MVCSSAPESLTAMRQVGHHRPEAAASLSVLMSCRNGLPFLQEAIDSVLASPQVLELLVADGGSSDGSLALLRQRAAEDPRLRLVSLRDAGVADALNRAFPQARGTVIGWLNADDRYLSGAPERALAALQQNPHWLMVYGEGDHIDAEGTVLEPHPTRPAAVGLDGFRDYCFICQPTVFWRRSLGVMLGPFDTRLQTSFDFDYWLRAFAAVPERIGHLPCRQAQTRLHDATISSTRLPRAVLEATLLQARHFADARPHLLQTYLRQIEAGSLSLPPGVSRRQHGGELLATAESLAMPARQLQAIAALLAPWLQGAEENSHAVPAAAGGPASAPARHQSAEVHVHAIAPVPRDAVLVLGTHRSGTSCLAGCLSRLGCEAPRSLIEACETNPRGFYESQPIHDLNEQVLAFLESDWADCGPLPLQRLFTPAAAALQHQAEAILRQQFPGRGPIVLKDPRLTRLLPFWLRVLSASGFRPRALLIHRHPLEVALSLQRRNRFSLEQGQRLWLVSVLEAEQASRNLPRCVVSYGQVLRQAPAIFARISRELQLIWPACRTVEGQAAATAAIAAFLSRDLQHHHAPRGGPQSPTGSLALPPELADWIARTHTLLERLAWGGADPGDRAELDRLRHQVQQSFAQGDPRPGPPQARVMGPARCG
ncbi:MAG: glycosyltransferase [Cyanobium sp.]